MTDADHPHVALTADQRVQIRQAAERLGENYHGAVNTGTIERFTNESLD